MRIEYRGKEQQQHEAENDIGKHVEIAIIEHQDHKAQHNRGTDPYDLHTRTRVKAEEISLAIVIAGTTHTHPSEDEESDIKHDRPIVERANHAFFPSATYLLYHS